MNESAVLPSTSLQVLKVSADRAEPSMCDKCRELDERIARYDRIALGINDQWTVDRIKLLIDELKDQKVRLHSTEQ
jgi:hypothetical protein